MAVTLERVDVPTFLRQLQEQGFVLTVADGRLGIRPAERIDAELRAELGRHRDALIVLLKPVTEFVPLKGGLTLPADAIILALNLEARGIPLAVTRDHQFITPDDPRLTPADLAAIHRWRLHLGAIVEYQAPEVA